LVNAADLLVALAGHCRVVVSAHGSVMASLFLTGLVGSFTHCTGMCGPLVAAQSVDNLGHQAPGQGGDWRRLAGAALIPYQLGRMTTYATLAAILSLPVGIAQFWHQFWWLAPALLALAASLFAVQALHAFGVTIGASRFNIQGAHRAQPVTGRLLARLQLGAATIINLARPLFRHPIGWRGYALGLTLGFLPCGLLYAALAAAAATGDVLAALLGMIVFTLGTFPISWAMGYGSVVAASRWRKTFKTLLPYLAILNAIFLLVLAYRYALTA
jgi:sulfite exporter TauE/SafE